MKIFLAWLPLAVALTVTAGLVYGAVQQDYRQTANDPQIQISADLARQLQSQTSQCDHVGPTADIATTLAPFVDVYTSGGTAVNFCLPAAPTVAAIGQLDNQLPTLPSGVFDYAKAHGQDRLTWQPRVGLRLAIVVTYYSGHQSGYVMVGRSLRDVEERENQLGWFVLAGWLIGLSLTLGLTAFKNFVYAR